MRIWLVTIGEPVPVQEGIQDRLHRTGYFAHLLSENGHDVIWWTSTYDHFRKKHWFEDDKTISVNDRLRIILLNGGGYASNVSLARFRDHRVIAKKFSQRVLQEKIHPDVLIAALPTIELCLESVKYGQKYGIPVILDMRDMWPDVFLDVLPKIMRPLGKLMLSPMYRQSRNACSGATSIVGVTEPFVDWGLQRGRRNRSPLDQSFGFGYIQTTPSDSEIHAATKFWEKWNLTADSREFVVTFVGTIGRQFELEKVINAARIVQKSSKTIRFVICGSGDQLNHYKTMADDLKNIIFPGWIGRAEIYTLLRLSSIGLAPYRDTPNFTLNIANKPAEYLSAGLPIGLSLKYGVLYDLLHAEKCGFSYSECPEELAHKIIRLERYPDERRVLAENAIKLFEKKFTADKVYGEMMKYLEHIVITTKSDPDVVKISS